MAKKINKFKISNRITDHIINAILIFASVFLAFWMNEKRGEKKELELTQIAKATIVSELKSNLNILEKWAPYHRNIYDIGIDSILNNIETISRFDLGIIPGFENGIQREIITTNGLELIKDGRVNFDIRTRISINRIYEQHHYVLDATNKITDDFLTQREIYDDKKNKENYLMFYSLVGELWGQENALIGRLKEEIPDLEK